jgi:hypothetical protein
MASDLRTFLRQAMRQTSPRVKREVGRLHNVRTGSLLERDRLSSVDERVQRFSRPRGRGGHVQDTPKEVVQIVARALDRGPSPYRVIPTGPVKEVVSPGGEADVSRLPVCVH